MKSLEDEQNQLFKDQLDIVQKKNEAWAKKTTAFKKKVCSNNRLTQLQAK